MTDLHTRQPLELVSAPEDKAAAWIRSLLAPGRPRRVSRMNGPNASAKYTEITDKSFKLTEESIRNHVLGRVTYAASLHDTNDMARCGVIEIDEGGWETVQRTLAAAQSLGLTAFAFRLDSGAHDGGHVWAPYDDRYPSARIVAQLRAVADLAGLPADTEIWPRCQGIRLPFGIHRGVNSRGTMLTQAGEVFHLDHADELATAIDVACATPTNSAPPEIAPLFNAPVADTQTANLHQRAEMPNASELESPRVTLADAPKKRGYDTTKGGRRFSPGELGVVREKFNRAHRLEDLLADYGATRTRDGYTCPCGVPHTHETTLYISRQGKLFSYSPRCRLHTTKGWDALGFYVLTQHNNDVNAALRELNPIESRQTTQEPPDYLTESAAEQRKKDRARRRHETQEAQDQRRTWQATQTARMAEENPHPTYQEAWALHARYFGTVSMHMVSVERMAADLCHVETPSESDVRKMQRANAWLVEHRYLVVTPRAERRNDGKQHTNIYTPAALDMDTVRVTRAADNVLSNVTLVDHDTCSIEKSSLACERAPAAPPIDLETEALAVFDSYTPEQVYDEYDFDLPELDPVPELPELLDATTFAAESDITTSECVAMVATPVAVTPDITTVISPEASYNPARDWTNDAALQPIARNNLLAHEKPAMFRPRGLLSPMTLIERPELAEQAAQATLLADGGQQVPVVVVEAKANAATVTHPRYRTQIATMGAGDLAKELEDLQAKRQYGVGRTSGIVQQKWARDLDTKIGIVEAAIDQYERARSAPAEGGTGSDVGQIPIVQDGAPPPSQAPTGPLVLAASIESVPASDAPVVSPMERAMRNRPAWYGRKARYVWSII